MTHFSFPLVKKSSSAAFPPFPHMQRFVSSVRRMSSLPSPGPVQRTIASKLESSFSPNHVEVINESFMHNVPRGSETHFKVVVVSESFGGKSLVERHRSIMDCLGEELKSGVHALSIVAKTPAQWEKSSGKVPPSPNCLGGKAAEEKNL